MSENIPNCVGLIMDGNRRWAKQAGLPAFVGHKKGFDTIKDLIRVVHENKIPHLVIYAFSTENWRRAKEEVGFLMNILSSAVVQYFSHDLEDLKRVRVRFIGDLSLLDKSLQNSLAKIENLSNQPTAEITVWVALSYGGRAEIVNAVNKAVELGEKVDEQSFSKLLWSAEMPDPDLIIRTGGEQRLSNFLTWQSVYSELFFTSTYWPAFTKEEFQRILNDYADRERRIGK